MEGNGLTKDTLFLAGHQIKATVDTTDTKETSLNLTVSLSWGGRFSFSVSLPHAPQQPTDNKDEEIQGDDGSPPKDGGKKRKRGSEKERTQQKAKRQHIAKTAMAKVQTIHCLAPEIMEIIFLELPLRTFGQLSGVCKTWHTFCGEQIWKKFFLHNYGAAPFLTLSWKERVRFCSSRPAVCNGDEIHLLWRAAIGLPQVIDMRQYGEEACKLACRIAVFGANLEVVDSLVRHNNNRFDVKDALSRSLAHVRDIKVWEHLTQRHQATQPSDFALSGLANPGTEDVLAAAMRVNRQWDDGDELSGAAYSATEYGYSIALIEPLLELSGVPLNNLIHSAVEEGHTRLLVPLLCHPGIRLPGDGSGMYSLFACRDPCKIPRIYRTLLPRCEGELDVRHLLARCLRAMGTGWQCWSADREDTPESNPAVDLLRDILRGIISKEEDPHALIAEAMLAAVRWAPIGAVRVLVEEGRADINAGRTKTGKTALMLAAKRGRSEDLLRYLLEMGADPRIRDSTNKLDALTLATTKRHYHLANVLLPLAQK